MMRFMGAMACWIVAIDCVTEAITDHLHVFQAPYAWLWWIVAACWVFNGVGQFVR